MFVELTPNWILKGPAKKEWQRVVIVVGVGQMLLPAPLKSIAV